MRESFQKAQAIAEDLKNLSCIECTRDWLKKHQGLTDPIQDITNCAALGLISPELQERLVDEIKKINQPKIANNPCLGEIEA